MGTERDERCSSDRVRACCGWLCRPQQVAWIGLGDHRDQSGRNRNRKRMAAISALTGSSLSATLRPDGRICRPQWRLNSPATSSFRPRLLRSRRPIADIRRCRPTTQLSEISTNSGSGKCYLCNTFQTAPIAVDSDEPLVASVGSSRRSQHPCDRGQIVPSIRPHIRRPPTAAQARSTNWASVASAFAHSQ